MSSINVDYDVLNQKGSPAWYSDLFANIPTPGYKGRMFISTDTFAFYRDNGVGWDLVGGPGTGTITGAGVFGQVTFFSGTDTISGNTDLVWDNTNKRLGINTGTPGAPLDIHSTGTAAQFNGTTTNNAFVLFQNAGTSKWRIGNLYNAGANDYQIFDVTNSIARLTIKNTGASTLIGTFTATSLIKSGGTNLQILLADGTTTPTSTFGAGSVTNVSAITLGTSGTDLTSTVANSTTTPTITLNVPTASATNRGALSSADWSTFNNKQATITLTTTGSSGAATLVGATLNVPNYTNVGTVTSVAALTLGTSGTDLSSSVVNSTSTPVITLNVPTASATNRGALSSADFTTFNNKQATISVTAPVVLTGATISMPAATTSVNGYLTSTDWNTFNNKSNTNGTVTSVVALTIGTTGIDITSTAVTTTTTPVITLNIPTASATNRGALSSTDWTTFNNKQATLSLTTTGTSGAATLVANTLNIPQYQAVLTNPVTGTGTTNYLPKFTGASTLGNSLVFDNGTNILIGKITSTGGLVQISNGTNMYNFDYDASGPYFTTVNNANTVYKRFTLDASEFYFNIAASTKMILNPSGILGLGVTPSAWYVSAGYNALQVGNASLFGRNSTNSELYLSSNTFDNSSGNPTYITSDFATRYYQNDGLHGWITAPSGTAGNAITFTQAMTLNASGNLSVGNTNDTYKLDVSGTGKFSGTLTVQNVSSGRYFQFVNDSSASYLDVSHSLNVRVNGASSLGTALQITSGSIINATSRGNFLGATDNALFSLNSGGTLYTVGFSPTATASSTNTLTLTTGTTTWIYTGSGAATWTLPNPSGNNQIYWIKNAGTGAITLTAFSGTNIINNSAASVSTVSIAVGTTVVIAQDGNVKSYQLQ